MTADSHPRVRNVGVRSRGYGSRSATKLGLKIEFDKYTTGQRFLGMKSLVLDNLWQDRALIREFMAMAVYRRMGEAAPRESFARLYINNVYQGLYAIVEDVTEAFVTRTIGDTGGYLYEYKFRNDFYMGYPGDDYADLPPDVRAAQSRARVGQHALRAAPSALPRDQRRRRRGVARPG